jgi:hypothetical protein
VLEKARLSEAEEQKYEEEMAAINELYEKVCRVTAMCPPRLRY